jgi:hypothetical protein
LYNNNNNGNCFTRCGSIFAFGHDNWHREIRARIVMELVINEGLYKQLPYAQIGSYFDTLSGFFFKNTDNDMVCKNDSWSEYFGGC